MAVWARVEVTPEDFAKVRDAIDQHVGREEGHAYPAEWVEVDPPVAWSRRIRTRMHKRWRSERTSLFPQYADYAYVDRLERKLNAVAPGIGATMIVEYRKRSDEMLFVIDIAAPIEQPATARG